MPSRVRERLSYANVMATLAVFLALGGGAWALSRNSVGPRQIKPNAVRSSDIRNQAVKGADVNEATLGEVSSAARADSAAVATSAQNANTATSANLLDNLDSSDFLRSNAAAGGALTGSYPNPALEPAEPFHLVGAPGEPSFQNDWKNATNQTPAGFYRDPFGRVHLKGRITGGTAGANVDAFRLPAGYGPDYDSGIDEKLEFAVATDTGHGRVQIEHELATNRTFVDIEAGGTPVTGFVALDGISFRCAPSGSSGCP